MPVDLVYLNRFNGARSINFIIPVSHQAVVNTDFRGSVEFEAGDIIRAYDSI